MPTFLRHCKKTAVLTAAISRNTKKIVDEMKARTVGIVDAFYSCPYSNCTSAVRAAYATFADFKGKFFNPYTICSMSRFTANCAQVLLQTRSPVYGSAENTMVSMLACAKLQAQTLFGLSLRLQLSLLGFGSPQPVSSDKDTECNCIPIDARPIPEDQGQCFSADFIDEVKDFIEVNFGRVTSNYAMKEGLCDYKQLQRYISQIKVVALKGVKLLQSTSSKLTEVDAVKEEYIGLLPLYASEVQNYILNNPKSCYSNVRASRTSPLTVTDAIFAILIQCVQYADEPNKRC